jgi:hypothetical protein
MIKSPEIKVNPDVLKTLRESFGFCSEIKFDRLQYLKGENECQFY